MYHLGLLWLVNGGSVVDLHRDQAILETERGARQCYRRRPVEVGRVVLAWELKLLSISAPSRPFSDPPPAAVPAHDHERPANVREYFARTHPAAPQIGATNICRRLSTMIALGRHPNMHWSRITEVEGEPSVL